jgi:hypothetical protein
MWGIFKIERVENPLISEIHIAPCHENGIVFKEHLLKKECSCHPVVERRDDTMIYIHNQIN